MADKEISITTEGIVLKGDIVDDVRAPVRRVANTADSALRLASNLLRLPLDFTSTVLERFRQKYADRFEEIPPANRREPPTRIACAVMQHVAYTADEPDIQDLFANLLATASNSETVHHVHPGFATIISELRPVDAVVLQTFASGGGRVGRFAAAADSDGIPEHVFEEAISNLVRLGLLDWRMKRYSHTELKGLSQKSYGVLKPEQATKMLVDVINDVQRLKSELVRQLTSQHQRVELDVTSFGRHFLAAVAEPQQESGETT